MALVARTFESATVTAKADGGLYQSLLSDGIIWGCSMSVTSSSITIQPGEIMIGGRVAQFDSAYTFALSPSLSSGYGRVILNAKLDASTPVYLTADYSATQTFPALTTEAINNTGNLYQIAIAVCTVASSSIGSIVSTIGSAKGGHCLLNAFYPVGSIYMSVNNVNPSQFMGGTWVQWGSGRVPVGVSSDTEFNSVEKTGGEKSHIITASEMPSHNHSITSNGSHRHQQTLYASYQCASNTTSGIYGMSTGSATDEGLSNLLTVASGSHTHTIGNSGSGSAHNNLQPYITCYMWKRTA